MTPADEPPRELKWGELGREFAMYRRLASLSQLKLTFLPLMIVLAIVESLFEGISLALIIPLMQTLGGSLAEADQGRLLTFFTGALANVPRESQLIVIVLAILGAVILKSVVSYGNMVVLGIVYGRLSHNLRTGVFRTIMDMPLSTLERERSGRLLNILNTETWRASDALNTLFGVVTSLSTFVVLLALLLLLSWQLTLIALLCVGLIPPLIQLLNVRVKKLAEKGQKANALLTKRTWMALSGLRTIHAFGREDYETKRFADTSASMRDTFFTMALIAMTTGPVTEIMVTIVVGALALMIDANNIAVPTLVGFLAILYRLQPRVLSLGTLRTKLVSLHPSVSEVASLLSDTTATPIKSGNLSFKGLRDHIRFRNVTFTYRGTNRPAVTNLSVAIKRGSVTAIVGSSGAGKSTILDLLLRFQDPQIGLIEIDGTPLSEFDLKSWRSRIAVVSQDPYIFDESVRANILYGRLEATEKELVNAARLACADEFIAALPQGYDTIVGERGTQISGGQRQRLSLARALVRDPDILILDEATNALDAMTERSFQEALRQNVRDRTVIIVAHRLTMVEMADHVVVLSDGKLIEEGSPRSLLRVNSQFAELFRSTGQERVATVLS